MLRLLWYRDLNLTYSSSGNFFRNLYILTVDRLPNDDVLTGRIQINKADDKRRSFPEHRIGLFVKERDNGRIGPVVKELGNPGSGIARYSSNRISAGKRISHAFWQEKQSVSFRGSIMLAKYKDAGAFTHCAFGQWNSLDAQRIGARQFSWQ